MLSPQTAKTQFLRFVEHLRSNRNTEYEASAMRQREEDSTVSGAAARHHPGTEGENVELQAAQSTIAVRVVQINNYSFGISNEINTCFRK